MKNNVKYFCCALVLISGFFLFSSFFKVADFNNPFKARFPYQQQGLTERQAAAHLLSRFTYGATPGQIDEVTKTGLENWFSQQLNANMPDDSLNELLMPYDALKLSNTQIVNEFPKNAQVLRMAVNAGVVNKDSVKTDRKEYRDVLKNYVQQNGMRPEQELYRQLISQKILRAAYSNNQLQEVMTSFWFNHFNVSITKNDCAQFIPAYERDVIRPNALGKFSNLLLATAKSPAMLYYLDNFTSSGAGKDTAGKKLMARRQLIRNVAASGADSGRRIMTMNKLKKAKNTRGLNENYAREVMELHTLGVDGGYTQQDVTQAAKVLTGWTIYPMGQYGKLGKNMMGRINDNQLESNGFVRDSDFLFNANRHDKSEKVVLGRHFGPNDGYLEGVQLLNMLAHNTATARFISRKIAVRFVNDNPPQSLVDKMTKTYLAKDGDIKQVLMTMVSSPEFWSPGALREKTKSPFELAIGAVRSLHASIVQPYQLYNWINKMGEKVYYYQAPTGFPDKGQYWINTGSLLNRMNFGLALAAGRIPGVKVDLPALNNHHEPESAQAALAIYSKIIMPERKLDETIKRLTPLLNDPNLIQKVDAASSTNNSDVRIDEPAPAGAATNKMQTWDKMNLKGKRNNTVLAMQGAPGNNAMLGQVVGIIIGSPEYQRR